MKKDIIRNIINIFAIIYALFIIVIIVPMLDFFLLGFNLLFLVILIITSYFLKMNINDISETFNYKMENDELKTILKENLKKEKYKYSYESTGSIKKIYYQKSYIISTLLVHEKMVIFLADKYDDSLLKSIKKELQNVKEYNKEHGHFRISTLKAIIFVNNYEHKYKDYYITETIFSNKQTIQLFTPFIIDTQSKIVYMSKNFSCSLTHYALQTNKMKRLFKGIY